VVGIQLKLGKTEKNFSRQNRGIWQAFLKISESSALEPLGYIAEI
jgi:hypothetical protein